MTARPTAILFAKVPRPGTVKTRLSVGPGGLSAEDAASVAAAMLECTLERVVRRWRTVVAVAPDGESKSLVDLLRPEVATRIAFADQGSGNLGARLDRLWQALAADAPVVFFGADTPDLPEGHLSAVDAALGRAEAAVGPTPDGGYWTLASTAYRPALLASVDWGTECVYDQTCDRAARGGIDLETLPEWPDVDRPADVTALRERLAGASNDPALSRLAERLEGLGGVSQRPET